MIPETRGAKAPDGRKVKGTLHWVSAAHAVEAEVRLYSPLFADENPALQKISFQHLGLILLKFCKAVSLNQC